KTIAFHGEPANGLQVMGMLETRNLDFRNLIILSANEGMLPKASHMPSFIPYFLRDVHRLTTIEKQTSLYAYYFYRLLQRADNVALVYNNYTEGLRKGEMSRFLLQLQLDPIDPSKSPLLRGDFQTTGQGSCSSPQEGRSGGVLLLNSKLTYSPNTAMTRKVEYMEKTEAGLARMLDSLQYTFSPSALKTYIQCPLQFYFKYVARLREQDEISDDIEDSTFGTIIHEVMRELYEPYVGRELTSTVLQAMHKNDTAIRALVDKQFAINVFHEDGTVADPATWGGSAILNRDVIIRYIHSQLLHDAAIAPIHLIALEVDPPKSPLLRRDFPATGQGSYPSPQEGRSGGVQGRSGRVHLSPSLNYIKLLGKPHYQSIVTLPSERRGGERQPVLDYREQCHEEFHAHLVDLVTEILDTRKPFTASPTDSPCRFCPFTTLCGKPQNEA
ncbi:MAG: PD-(D/E)XK nuclease family protein, partial [Bacteroidales bacterium]|nr:PD-(D/E)XK nuclease family protein [Bacteroidales bacterium]